MKLKETKKPVANIANAIVSPESLESSTWCQAFARHDFRNWDALGALAEFAGASGVIFSVLYLAIQVRAQNRESRVAAAHEIIAAFRSMQVPLQSADLAELWHKAIADSDGLRDPERMQVLAVVAPMLRVWEEAYLQQHSGQLDEEPWEMMVARFRDRMSARVFQVLWDLRKHVRIKRFAAYVDSVEPDAENFSRLYKTVDARLATPNKAVEADA